MHVVGRRWVRHKSIIQKFCPRSTTLPRSEAKKCSGESCGPSYGMYSGCALHKIFFLASL